MTRIVVVEDESAIWNLLEFKLKKAGFEIFHASDGEEAIEMVRRHVPDLILLDIMIPYPDGFQVLKIIKSDPALENIPVVILSSLSQDGNILDGLKLGAEDYITKPFSPEELILRIRKVLGRTRAMNARGH